jgi:hypothetical protein
MDQILWEHDVDAAAIGERSAGLRLTAGMFAANRAIAQTQSSILETLTLLRFKRSTYEWYRGSATTYYDLETLDDAVLAVPGANGWVRVGD